MTDILKERALVPEENITVDFAVTEDKSYNKCFKCNSFRVSCSGPDLPVAGIERTCEFLQMTRIFLGYSYQQVADGTASIGMPVSLNAIKRILPGKVPNPDYYSVVAISKFLLGVPDGSKQPCAIPNIVSNSESEAQLNDALRDLERLHADNKEYREIIDNIHRSYKAEMDAIREEAQKKIDFLLSSNQLLRSDLDSWRAESDRKSKLIDKYLDKWAEGK